MIIGPQRVKIRTYTAGDAKATLAIFTNAITETATADYSPEQIEAWARPGKHESVAWHLALHKRNSFVATVNGEVAGFSDVDDHGYVDMLFVAPKHQRKGVAFLLLREAERRARETRATSLTVNASITALPFFERQGFVVEEKQENVRQGVMLVSYRMRKVLD